MQTQTPVRTFPPSSDVGRRPKHNFKPVVNTFASDLLLAKGTHTASALLNAALLHCEIATFPELADTLFKIEGWPGSDLRDLMAGFSKHLTMVHAGVKINPKGIMEAYRVAELPLPAGYDSKVDKRVLKTVDHVAGAAAYLNGLFRRGRLEKNDLWLDLQANVLTADLANLLTPIIAPAILERPKGAIDKTELQRSCQAHGLTLTGNCAVTLIDLMRDELDYLKLIDGKPPERVAQINQNRASAELKKAKAQLERAKPDDQPAAQHAWREAARKLVAADEALLAAREVAREAEELAQLDAPPAALPAEPIAPVIEVMEAGTSVVVPKVDPAVELYRVVEAVVAGLVKEGRESGVILTRELKPIIGEVQPHLLYVSTTDELTGFLWEQLHRHKGQQGIYRLLPKPRSVPTSVGLKPATAVSEAWIGNFVEEVVTVSSWKTGNEHIGRVLGGSKPPVMEAVSPPVVFAPPVVPVPQPKPVVVPPPTPAPVVVAEPVVSPFATLLANVAGSIAELEAKVGARAAAKAEQEVAIVAKQAELALLEAKFQVEQTLRQAADDKDTTALECLRKLLP